MLKQALTVVAALFALQATGAFAFADYSQLEVFKEHYAKVEAEKNAKAQATGAATQRN